MRPSVAAALRDEVNAIVGRLPDNLARVLNGLLEATVSQTPLTFEDINRLEKKPVATGENSDPSAKVESSAENAKQRSRKFIMDLRTALSNIFRDSAYRGRKFEIPKGKRILTFAQEVWVPRVRPADLHRLLTAICELEGISKDARAQKYISWRETLGTAEKSSDLRGYALGRLNECNDFESLFAAVADVQQFEYLSSDDVKYIAEAFGIHPVLLHPLLPEPTSHHEIAVTLDLEDFREFPQEGAHLGKNSHYLLPRKRLLQADAATGIVRLEANGRSDKHKHPGDEIVLVRRGEAEACFEQSGVRIRLRARDIIHFHAEREHQFINPHGQEAEVLVIRFYQIDADTRLVLWRDLNAALSQGSGTVVPPHAVAWIRQILPIYCQEAKKIVQDPLGLARFLEQCSRFLPEITRDGNLEAAKSEAMDAIGDLERLKSIAAQYKVEEFLLENFTHPSSPEIAVLRRSGADDDFESPSGSNIHHGTANYRLPKRSLVCSDIAVAQITLPANATTSFNLHPGFEMIIVERGTVQIEFEGRPEKLAVSATDGPEICQFDSMVRHRISNVDPTEPAEFLTVRFYRDGARKSHHRHPTGHVG